MSLSPQSERHWDSSVTASRSGRVPQNQPTGRAIESAVGDRQLQERVQQVINSTGYHVLSRSVEVHATDGCVTLTGAVSRYYLKQLAQTAAMQVAGVNGLQNELRVTSVRDDSSGSTAQPQG
jgi:osmotically-inducible protein OsmY